MDIKGKQLAIFEHYGSDHQLDRLIEECAELIKAIMKFKRNGFTEVSIDSANEMISEMADVTNLIEQFEHGAELVKTGIQDIKTYKVDREIERINGRKSNGV